VGRRWWGPVLFGLFGAAGLAWLIVRADPARLWRDVASGAAWLPLLCALEGMRIAVEAWGSRKLYERHIPFRILFRATLVAYAIAALAPGGRASGEGVKAALLRRRTELSDTAAAATTIQTCSLLALGGWSVACVAVASFHSLPLAGAFVFQAAAVFLGAALLSGAVRTGALARLVGRFAPKARVAADEVRQRARHQHMRAPFLAFVLSRGMELVQYGLIFFAVTHRFEVVPMILTFGVATVAGSLGDSVPAQLGVIDGSFTAAAGALGISAEEALAFSMLVHALQIAWIAVGVLTPVAWRVELRAACAGDGDGDGDRVARDAHAHGETHAG
jgi:uncharacterized membrane protein YbhN (UPF0104 family)